MIYYLSNKYYQKSKKTKKVLKKPNRKAYDKKKPSDYGWFLI